MQKSNLVFIVSPGSIGGAERYIEDLAKGLQNRGYNIEILVSHNKEYAEEISQKFPKITHYIGNNLWKIFLSKSSIRHIKENSTIVSSGYHSLFLSLLLRIWMPFRGIRHIDIKHGWVKNNRFQKILTTLDKVLSIFCNFIVVVNSKMKSELKIITSRVVHIRTGIRQPSHQITTPPKQDMVRLGLVGRIEPEKRFSLGLQVANKVAEKYPAEIHIVGGGSLKDELLKSAYHKDLKRIFYGYMAREQVPYNNFDVLLITSITEGSPLVALEAMFLGKHIIANNVGNLLELLGEGRGEVVQGDSAAQLADEMSKLVISYHELDMNRKINMASNAQLYANQKHSIESMVDEYSKIL